MFDWWYLKAHSAANPTNKDREPREPADAGLAKEMNDLCRSDSLERAPLQPTFNIWRHIDELGQKGALSHAEAQ